MSIPDERNDIRDYSNIPAYHRPHTGYGPLLRQPERLQRLAVVLVVRLHELREASRIQIDHVEAAPVHELLELLAVPDLLDRGLVLRGNLLRQALGRRKAAPHTLVPLVTRRFLGGRHIREIWRTLG